MAAGDYNVADRVTTDANGDSILEAGVKVEQDTAVTPDAEARAWAEANGVSQAAYANYATALGAHTDRADIESLAARRVRENADTFAAADFMRNVAYNADGTAASAPRPGTMFGEADENVAGADGDAGTDTNVATAPTGYGDGDPTT